MQVAFIPSWQPSREGHAQWRCVCGKAGDWSKYSTASTTEKTDDSIYVMHSRGHVSLSVRDMSQNEQPNHFSNLLKVVSIENSIITSLMADINYVQTSLD